MCGQTPSTGSPKQRAWALDLRNNLVKRRWGTVAVSPAKCAPSSRNNGTKHMRRKLDDGPGGKERMPVS